MADYDLGAWALAKLEATTAVTGLVIGGATMILEAGDVTAKALADAQETRREAVIAEAEEEEPPEISASEKVLAIVVQDTGESMFSASCAVFVYDRYGYANIRVVREAVIAALVNCPAVLVRDALVNQVRYNERTGHVIDTEFDLDFERINFNGALITERDCYT